MEALRERMTRIEEALGEWPCEDGTVASWTEHTKGEVQAQRSMLESHDNFYKENWLSSKPRCSPGLMTSRRPCSPMEKTSPSLRRRCCRDLPQALKPLPKFESQSPKASMAIETRRNWRTSCGTSSSSLRLLMFLMARRFPSS